MFIAPFDAYVPFIFSYLFERYPFISKLTYLEPQIWFREAPSFLLNELDMAKKKILLTYFGNSPCFDISANWGKYSTQFMTIAREDVEGALKALQVSWLHCSGRGNFLDEWVGKYQNYVHVLERQDRTLAP